MLTTEDYLNSLKNDKKKLVENLNTKGVIATDKETFTELAPKVLEIKTGTEPSGTIDISENGIVDVTPYASANVNVSSGGGDFFIKKSTNSFKLQESILKIPLIDTSKATSMYKAFEGFTGLTTIPLLDTSNVNDMRDTFKSCSNLTTIPLLDTNNVNDMTNTFQSCSNLTEIPLIDVSKVTKFGSMFSGCNNLKTIPKLNTIKASYMSNIFNGCSNLKTIPLLNISTAYDISNMFANCTNLETVPLLDTSNAKNMNGMFQGCRNLKTIPQFNTGKNANVSYMFYNCTNLESVPLLDAKNVVTVYSIFDQCTSLKEVAGLKDLGMKFEKSTGENSYYKTLNCSYSTLLTKESLLNIINNLYDIKSIGIRPQKLIFGATNIAKLTPEEISIATNKGWNVS